jgi:esterase/lipase superfamily enzyme
MLLRFPALALLATLLGMAPSFATAQSIELLRAMQKTEAAKVAGKVDEALKSGDAAAALLQAANDTAGLAELYQNLADYAAQSGKLPAARQYYQRALAALESSLGPEHPDLAPLLDKWADLELKDKKNAKAEELLRRCADIERKAFGPYHPSVLATLEQLRSVYRADNDAAAVARIETEMQPPPPSTRGLPTPGGRRYKSENGFATVRVFYGTNRAPTGSAKPADFYGKARGELQYGWLDVTIPETHKEAELETQPRWIEMTFNVTKSQMRSQYVLLDRINPLSRDDFAKALKEQVAGAPSHDLFVFVHGYNNSFEDAARRAAQLAYDLDFDGTPLLYSWPSQASSIDYTIDEAVVGISGRRMAEFLDTVVGQSGAQRIHLIAHSMGNRTLIEAMQAFLAKRAPEQRKHVFGQLVFTAPDVDRDYFSDAVAELSAAAERTTLYASDNDYALRSSQLVHGAPRAGTAGDVIVRLAGLDSIDMSQVPADSLGHSYFAANAGAIYDIFRLLWRGEPPPQRCGMSSAKGGSGPAVWLFHADICKGDDMLEAGVLLKRFGDLARQRVVQNIASFTDPNQKQQWSQILKRLDGLTGTNGTAGAKP